MITQLKKDFKMNKKSVLLLGFLPMFLIGCTITPPKPDVLPPTDYPEPRISDISIPIDVSLSGIATMLNREIPTRLVNVPNTPIGIVSGTPSLAFKFDSEVYIDRVVELAKERNFSQSKVDEIIEKNRLFFENEVNINALGKIFSGKYRLHLDRGTIYVDAGKDLIKSGMAFDGQARVEWMVCIGWWHRGKCRGIKYSDHADANIGGSAAITSLVSIKPDWKISSRTKVTVKVTVAVIRLGPFRISLRSIVQPIVNREIRRVGPKLDTLVSNTVNVRKEIEKIWPELSRAHKASSEPDVYVQFVPSEFAWGGISKPKENTARLGIGLKASSKVSISDKPDDLPVGSIPRVITRTPSGLFNINVPILIDMEYVGDIIEEAVDGRVYKALKGTTIEVTDVDLTVNGNNIVTKVWVKVHTETVWWNPLTWFDTRGYIYLKGVPTYNTATREVSITNVDFDVNTNQYLLNKAADLLHKPMIKALEKALKAPIGEQLDKATTAARNAIQSVNLGDKATFNGYVNSVEIKGVYTAGNKELGIDVYLKGSSKIIITP